MTKLTPERLETIRFDVFNLAPRNSAHQGYAKELLHGITALQQENEALKGVRDAQVDVVKTATKLAFDRKDEIEAQAQRIEELQEKIETVRVSLGSESPDIPFCLNELESK